MVCDHKNFILTTIEPRLSVMKISGCGAAAQLRKLGGRYPKYFCQRLIFLDSRFMIHKSRTVDARKIEQFMKEAGLKGQDILTLMRLYVGSAEGDVDSTIQNQTMTDSWSKEVFQKVGLPPVKPTLSQKALSMELGVSPAEMSGVILRCKELGLLNSDFTVQIQPFLKLLENGLRYFLPALSGKDTLGVPTAWGNPTIAKILRGPAARIPVWTADTGEVHGPAVTPLFRSVPYLVPKHPKLYAALSAVDLLRLGGAREIEVALEVLKGLKA